jgi:hypothetical protein
MKCPECQYDHMVDAVDRYRGPMLFCYACGAIKLRKPHYRLHVEQCKLHNGSTLLFWRAVRRALRNQGREVTTEWYTSVPQVIRAIQACNVVSL